jgi:Fe-S-cluster containining protein
VEDGEFKREYGKAQVSDGKETWVCLKRNEGGCVFLNPLGQCSIYDVRPVQCSTYPFWPSLLASREEWEDESVIPDDLELKENERYWTAELGGCEGIMLQSSDGEQSLNDDESKKEEILVIDRREISSKMKAAKRHWDSFPIEEIKQSTWYL